MTSPAYKYVGTITSWELFRSVAMPQRLGITVDTTTDAKGHSASDQATKPHRPGQSAYRDRFTPERLVDAKAICAKEWGIVSQSSGACPVGHPRRRLPTEPSVAMRAAGVLRHRHCAGQSQVSPVVPVTT